MNKKAKSNGFTLLEMLLVLTVLSVFILLAIPIQHNVITKEKEKRFLEVLQFDILHVQHLATTTTDKVTIRFLSDHYVVLQSDEPLYRRFFPSDWIITMNTMSEFSFTSKGAIREVGHITIHTSQASYKLTCPLGKGRCYSVEQ